MDDRQLVFEARREWATMPDTSPPCGTATLVLYRLAGRQKAMPRDPHLNPEIETTCTNLMSKGMVKIIDSADLAIRLGEERDRLAALLPSART
ncbi:hypothetical protein PAPYR_10903 [Paratrimastix pyriformis]|uniref:Uncharacterized protein n=1 Tax=Paratrimastix pyriformis TaxID=342808 RepID=A0ABQ8U959_9EUKA|nr:hypothetical protein PAPYR_10903 [Paratrimastix pyriformis]